MEECERPLLVGLVEETKILSFFFPLPLEIPFPQEFLFCEYFVKLGRETIIAPSRFSTMEFGESCCRPGT